MTQTIERRYTLTRVRAGSYLLPSNDGQTLWHIFSFEDGRSHGIDEPDRTYWACARFRGTFDQAQMAAWRDIRDYGYLQSDRWFETDSYLRTRREAIDSALTEKVTL
jgi:hypothetical protein